eukprot:SM000065S20163  [mRNA]  locus=s65:172963:173738:+ [translate_table: standard]
MAAAAPYPPGGLAAATDLRPAASAAKRLRVLLPSTRPGVPMAGRPSLPIRPAALAQEPGGPSQKPASALQLPEPPQTLLLQRDVPTSGAKQSGMWSPGALQRRGSFVPESMDFFLASRQLRRQQAAAGPLVVAGVAAPPSEAAPPGGHKQEPTKEEDAEVVKAEEGGEEEEEEDKEEEEEEEEGGDSAVPVGSETCHQQ